MVQSMIIVEPLTFMVQRLINLESTFRYYYGRGLFSVPPPPTSKFLKEIVLKTLD